MEAIFFIAVIVILIIVVIGLLIFLKKKHKDYDQMMEDYQVKATASIAEIENDFQKKKEDEVEKTKQGYETKIRDYKEYIHSIEKFSRNTSEINTHNILNDIKNKLISQRAIDPLQMLVLANVFVPFKTSSGEIHATKVDHLVLMNTGIYIVGTKNWQGDVLYGISKEKAKEFPFIHDTLFSSEERDIEKTIVYKSSNSDSNELKVITIDKPDEQVLSSYKTLEQLLGEHMDNVHLSPILYIDHENHSLVNHSQNVVPQVFDKMETLYEFFVKEIEIRGDNYSISELEEIKNLIENVHITT